MRKPISRKILIIQPVAVLMLFCVLLVHATPTSNFNQNKTDQATHSSARIDPITLGLNIEIPLGSYLGRGGTSIPLTINYSSKVWTSDVYPGFRSPCWDLPRPCLNGINRPDRTIAVFANDSMSGWTSSLKVPKVVYTGKFQPFTQDGEPSCLECVGATYIQRIHVYLPDGSAHELRKSDAAADLYNNTDWSGTYYAVDGSQMRYETESKTLFLPNGSRYVIYGAMLGNDNSTVGNTLAQNIYDNYRLTQPAEYIDRNGNKLAYSPTTRKWTDTLGREFGSPFPADTMDPPGYFHTPNMATEGDMVYSLPGIGTGTIQYTFRWKKLSDSFSNTSYQVHYAGDHSGNQNTPALSPALFQNTGAAGTFNPVVLAEIVLPDSTSYKFGYNPYGEIDKLTYPTGAYEKFTYLPTIPINWRTGYSSMYDINELNLNRGITEHSISAKGDGTDEITTQYAASFANAYAPFQLPYKSTVTNPDGTITERLIYAENDYYTRNGFDAVPTGKVYEERLRKGATILRRTLTDWALSGPLTGGLSTATRNPHITRRTEILFEGTEALAKSTVFQHDQYQNLISTAEYDFVPLSYTVAQTAEIGQISLGTLLRTMETDYKTDATADAAYLSRQMISLPKETRVKNASGQIVSKLQIFYDQTANYPLLTYSITPANWQNPNTDTRGNATTTFSYYDIANSQYTASRAQYDQFGNLRFSWDGRNNQSEIQYTDNYSDSVNRDSYALPTKTISPIAGGNGSTTPFETSIKYDFNTGLPVSNTDANNQTTQISYADPITSVIDPLLRVRKVTAPNGQQTISEYGDGTSAATRYTKVKTQIDTNNWKIGYVWYDGLNKPTKSQMVNAASGDIFALTCYDAIGRVEKISNPFRGVSNPTCSSSLEWTTTTYDDLSRAVKVKTADNAEVSTAFALATSGSTVGTVITVTDQAGKQRRSVTNAVGQLKRVDEPTDTAGLGLLDSPNQPTYYDYNTLNNLTTVKQGGTLANPEQTRTFVYDSLSRLKSATLPELGTTIGGVHTSGTTSYTYDVNGNLQTKRDPRGIKIIYDYDNLNRVVKKCYRNIGTSGTLGLTTCANNSETLDANTPEVAYTYDNLLNAKGRLTKVTTTGVGGNTFSSATEYQAFDSMGRVTQSQQKVEGMAYGTTLQLYTYNLAGALIEETYPSGRVVKNVLDANGDFSMVQSKKIANSSYYNYARNFTYTAAGAVSSLQLGNGRWESTMFNSRLQPEQIALGTSANATDLLKLNFAYNTTINNVANADNNGNVLKQTITMPTETRDGQTYTAFTATQDYTYDALNRLHSAEETIPSQTGWKQTFKYDRYGNRNFDYGTNPTSNPQTTTPNYQNTTPKVVNPEVLTANNRFKQDQDNDSQDDYLYDASGNLTRDVNYKKFTYDGENKQTKVETVNTSGTVISTLGCYFYDGDGKRVKKESFESGQWIVTVFIYDAGGKLVAEYANPIITTTPQVSYLTSDHLGSPRINTDKNGIVISRHDYQPFGEEIYPIGGNTARIGYSNDNVRKQFTGYERDTEIDLDFAQARYYNKNLGRYNSPDPLSGSARLNSPASWNRYSYASNNPLNLVDPTGLWEWDASLGGRSSDGDILKNVCATEQCTKEELNAGKRPPSEAKNIVGERQKFRGAIEFLNGLLPFSSGMDRRQLEGAIADYGTENDGNGVNIFASTVQGSGDFIVNHVARGGRLEHDVYLGTGTSIRTWRFAIAHEGQHIWDANDYYQVFGANLTFLDYETNGFITEGIAVRAFGAQNNATGSYPAGEAPSEQIWNSGWAAADVATLRANGAQNLVITGGYNLSPTASGLTLSQRIGPRMPRLIGGPLQPVP